MFQFPSNGKVFPNESTVNLLKEMGEEFQFPSNGKVFPNAQLQETPNETGNDNVSIPFKREGISEPYRWL